MKLSEQDDKKPNIAMAVNSQNDQLNAPISKRYTQDQVANVIDRTHGLTSAICAALDCSLTQWNSYLKKKPQLKELQQQARQGMVDLAEQKLLENLNSDDPNISQRAAEFILRRLGRQLGWGDNTIVQQSITIDEGTKQIQQIFGIQEQ